MIRILKKIINGLMHKNFNKEELVYAKNIFVGGNFRTSVLRIQQNELLREAIRCIPKINTILNVGALPGENDKQGLKYELYFKDNIEFFTLDKNRESPDPHHFHMDLHDLSKINKKFDLIICMSTLEHVEDPFRVADEIINVMEKGSYLFISVPFFYPIHKDVYGRYGDYWRFTDDSLRILFKNLEEVWIKPMKSSIKSVRDRKMYWEPSRVPAGFGALFKKI